VAQSVKHVVGVELIEEAIENAKTNAALNQIHNTTFIAGDLMRLFTPEFIRQNGTPDVLIVDPPRAGMHPKVVEQIAALKPKRLVYVSCNPMTQVRDIALLGDLYEVEALQPVDMFPHTHHIESVAKLRLKE
jgi:23S rRNA (uracil1939-C5)-methyltransferase